MNEKSDDERENVDEERLRYESYQTQNDEFVVYDGKNPSSYIKTDAGILIDLEKNR